MFPQRDLKIKNTLRKAKCHKVQAHSPYAGITQQVQSVYDYDRTLSLFKAPDASIKLY